MANELITVTQLPVIEDRLREVKETITRRVNEALSMVVSEETVKCVKAMRADIRKEYAELEDRRKEVKASILEPYTRFEAVYKECAGDIYADADRQLKEKIDAVEGGLRAQKAERLRDFYNEYRAALNVPEDLTSFENAPIKVTLSASDKSLRDQVAAYLDRIAGDIAVISGEEYADEIMAEFRRTLNGHQAITAVRARHEAIEAERRRAEEARAEAQRRAEMQRRVEEIAREETPAPLAAPVETVPEQKTEKMYTVAFTVTATREKLIELKNYLNNGGYRYDTK